MIERMARTRRSLLGLGSWRPLTIWIPMVLAVALLGIASSAGANEREPISSVGLDPSSGDAPRIDAVDAVGDRLTISVLWPGPQVGPETVELFDEGEPLDVERSSASAMGRSAEVMVVMEASTEGVSSGVFDSYVAGLADSVETFEAGPIALGAVVANDRPTLTSRLLPATQRPAERIPEVLSTVVPSKSVALYDAISLAANAFGDTPDVTRTLLVLASGNDAASASDALRQAEAKLLQSGVQVLVVPGGQPGSDLARLASRTNGLVLGDSEATGPDSDAVEAAVVRAGALAVDRQVFTAPSVGATERRNARLVLDAWPLSFSYPSGTVTENPQQLFPRTYVAVSDGGFTDSPVVLYVSILLAFAAIATATWSIGSVFIGEASLDNILARYTDEPEDVAKQEVQALIVHTAIMKRAVDITEKLAARRGLLARAEALLERADLPVKAAEALFFIAAIAFLVVAVVGVSAGNLLFGFLAGLITLAVCYVGLEAMARRRFKQFQAQLPDALNLLAGTLRAGYSLPQGLDAVAREISDPMGNELRRALTEAQLGRDIEDSLANVADRLGSDDFAWVVMAIGIQRDVGGNLAEVLVSVADTMVQRERLKREVDALTAEGRVSAAILAFLPPGLGAVMWVMNPSYISVLFESTLGFAMLAMAVVSATIGLAWMQKVISVDA